MSWGRLQPRLCVPGSEGRDRLLARLTLRSEEHTSELQSRQYVGCRLLLEKNGGRTRPTDPGDIFEHSKRAPPPDIAISLLFFNDTATTEIYTLSLHDALPIYPFFTVSIRDRRTLFDLIFDPEIG